MNSAAGVALLIALSPNLQILKSFLEVLWARYLHKRPTNTLPLVGKGRGGTSQILLVIEVRDAGLVGAAGVMLLAPSI